VPPQEGTVDTEIKVSVHDGLSEDKPQFVKTDELDRVYILDPQISCPVTLPQRAVIQEGYLRAVGNRRHFQYGDPDFLCPSDSDEEDLDFEDSQRDKEFAKTCAKAVSNCLSRRISRAMIDLIGIEPNPGPVTGKRLTNLVSNLLSSGGGQQKKGKKNKQKRSSQNSSARPANTTKMSGVPAAFGMIAPRAYFGMRGVAQRLADQDSLNSVRAEGCALMSLGITTNPSAASNVTGGLNSPLIQNNGFLNITPSSVDPRLNALAQTYQFYAFRRLVLKYIPFTGTTTTGGLYMAIGKDADQVVENFSVVTPGVTGFSGGTPQNVMEYDPSLMTAIWQPAALTFRHSGTELWQTFPNGEEPTNERIQASVVAIVEGTPDTVNSPKTYGHLWLEYEIDFYVPGPPLSASSGQGGTLFMSVPAVQGNLPSGIPGTTPGLTFLDVQANESVTGPVLINFSVVNGTGTTQGLVLQALDTLTGTLSLVGDPVSASANAVSQVVIPFAMEAGRQYLFNLLAPLAGLTGATLRNIFIKSANG
jgi:hypothetical protein